MEGVLWGHQMLEVPGPPQLLPPSATAAIHGVSHEASTPPAYLRLLLAAGSASTSHRHANPASPGHHHDSSALVLHNHPGAAHGTSYVTNAYGVTA